MSGPSASSWGSRELTGAGRPRELGQPTLCGPQTSCQKFYFQNLEVKEDIGARGWAMLRQALELPDRRDPDWNYCLTSTREAMVEGSKDDLRAIFEGVHKWTVGLGEDKGESRLMDFSSDGAENMAWKILVEVTLDFWRQRIKAKQ